MQPHVRTYLVNDAGQRVFGPGPAELLRRVREQGSLRAAAISMGMAYTKALALVRNAEAALGCPLTTRVVGGAGGGGSTPTPEAEALLDAYERWNASVSTVAASRYDSIFGKGGPAFAHAGARGTGAAASDAPSSALGGSNASAQPGSMVKGSETGGLDAAANSESGSAGNVASAGGLGSEPFVGACILAAGHAVRFGSNKLVEPLLGEPVLRRTLGCVPPGMPMVVASNSPEVDALCDARGIDRVRPDGLLQADSVRALAAYAKAAGWDAAVFVPGDQPLVEPDSIRSLLAMARVRPDAVVRLSWRGRAASPALFPASAFDALEAVSGDVGGSAAISADMAKVSVEASWPWELWDIDTPDDLARIRDLIESGLARGLGS